MKKCAIALAVASALSLAACTTEQHYTIEAPPPPEVPGPPQPGVPSGPPPLTGTAGPLSPGRVGHYMDGLETDLRVRLRQFGIRVARRGDEMVVTLPNDKLFGGAVLSAAGQSLLAVVAAVLSHYDHTQLQVNGYTDTSGTKERNLMLSQRRATIVGAALSKEGVAAPRITAEGFGQEHLRIRTGDNVSEPRNRRIEIQIVPKPGS